MNNYKMEKKMKKIIAGIMIAVGLIGLCVLIVNGMLLPHILGPITLSVIGVLLLITGKANEQDQGDQMLYKRISLLVVAAAVLIVIVVAIGMFGPALMKSVLDMHKA
jgi:vacuolar-type H+-ATPase subunit I/STV1